MANFHYPAHHKRFLDFSGPDLAKRHFVTTITTITALEEI